MIFIVKQTATVIKDGDGGSESKRRHTTRPNKIVKLLCYTLDMVNFCKWYLDGSIGQVCMCVWITNTSLFLSYFGLCFICSVSALYLPCVSPSLLPPPPPPPPHPLSLSNSTSITSWLFTAHHIRRTLLLHLLYSLFFIYSFRSVSAMPPFLWGNITEFMYFAQARFLCCICVSFQRAL